MADLDQLKICIMYPKHRRFWPGWVFGTGELPTSAVSVMFDQTCWVFACCSSCLICLDFLFVSTVRYTFRLFAAFLISDFSFFAVLVGFSLCFLTLRLFWFSGFSCQIFTQCHLLTFGFSHAVWHSPLIGANSHSQTQLGWDPIFLFMRVPNKANAFS